MHLFDKLSRSLCQSIRNRRPTPTNKPAESTVLVDVEEMGMDVDGVSLRVYDFPGQVTPCVFWWKIHSGQVVEVVESSSLLYTRMESRQRFSLIAAPSSLTQ